MAGMTPDKGRGRCLPQWMLGINAPDKVQKPNDGDAKSCLKGLASQVCQPKAEAETQKPEKAVLLDEKSSSLPKCEAKRTKRKPSMQDADHDNVITTAAVEKKKYSKIGRKVSETSSLERKIAKERLRMETKEELDISSSSDDDVELTVEDLITIAEEYVKADKEMEQQRPSSRECESERHLLMTTSRTGFRGSPDAPSDQASCCSTETLMNEKAVTETSITGDSTRDMLDLLLGPLLKKSPAEEKKAEFKAIDYAFSYNLEKQHPNNRVEEEILPLLKKKSSLRDKIAMFLD